MVLGGVDAAVQFGGQALAPQRHLGGTLVERAAHMLEHAGVAIEEIGSDRDGLRVGPVLPLLQHRFQIQGLGAEDVQRPQIVLVADQDGDIPSRHHPVVDPAAGVPHRVEHGRRDDVEPVPHIELCGDKSRPSDSAYPLNTSASRIEGSSSHRVSIPLIKARISTALPAASSLRGTVRVPDPAR